MNQQRALGRVLLALVMLVAVYRLADAVNAALVLGMIIAACVWIRGS